MFLEILMILVSYNCNILENYLEYSTSNKLYIFLFQVHIYSYITIIWQHFWNENINVDIKPNKRDFS